MHETPDGEMSHHESIEFLPDQIRSFAAQGDLPSAQVGLQLIEGRFDFPALVIKDGQLFGGGLGWIQDGCRHPVTGFGIWDAVQGLDALQFWPTGVP